MVEPLNETEGGPLMRKVWTGVSAAIAHRVPSRLLGAAAIAVVSVVVGAGTAEALTPVDGGDAVGVTIAINTGGGEQLDPRVSGDLAVYTDASQTLGQIRFYDFITGVDGLLPASDPNDIDALSDVNG